MLRVLPLLFVLLAACDVVTMPAPLPNQGIPTATSEQQRRADQAARQFIRVVETVEPVAERICRDRSQGINCDFLIVVDDRPGQPPNAFQTLDRDGRPVLAFNLALIASAQNADELAFVMGHEAAHHILRHLEKVQQSATIGATILSGVAAITGASAEGVRSAEQLGAAVGARTYSKAFELEADRLGTVITAQAGYDPIKGAAFFAKIPDPGNRFLGTHPANADRLEAVRDVAAGL